MNYNAVVPTLERIALIRTAVILWSQDDVTTAMNNCCYPLFHKELRLSNKNCLWKGIGQWLKMDDEIEKIGLEMEKKVTGKVPQLPIPNPLKEDLVHIIKPIGEEILKWIQFHGWNIGINLPRELCWLPRGTVDEKRTAKLLIKDENIDTARRYKLACIYCLEEDIPKLWKKVPSTQKKKIHLRKGSNEIQQHELVAFWTHTLMEGVNKWEKIIKKNPCAETLQRAVEIAANTCNKAAIEYFLQKLTSTERDQSLMKCAEILAGGSVDHLKYDFPRENNAHIFTFLFCQMNEQQQLEVLQNHSSRVLLWFLEWPWQQYFMETAKCVWGFLDEWNLYWVLERIYKNVVMGYKDYNYKNLFREFWQLISIHHEKIVEDYIVDGSLLTTLLFFSRDKENINLILEDASTEVREKIIFSYEGKKNCARLLHDGNEDLLKFLVQACIPSKDKMNKFKKELEKHIPKQSLESGKDTWSKFSEMLDGAFHASVKL